MKGERITLAHGAGGRLTQELIRGVFIPTFANEALRRMDDSAVICAEGTRLALTTDAYVVRPLRFPGGDIGRLAICGTINDLAMVGGRPLGVSASFIIEEGFPVQELERFLSSMKEAAQEGGVEVVTGDTKVVELGSADGLYITTAGVGIVPPGVHISSVAARPGDLVIVSGPMGDHEAAVLLARGEFPLQGAIASDCAPLNSLVEAMLATGSTIRTLRDPTRGGLATSLWEIAQASRVGLIIDEAMVPIRREVKALCDLLGFDPFYMASEGRLVAFVPQADAYKVLEAMQGHPLGSGAAVIGRVVAEHPGEVLLRTAIGGHRLLEPLSGEQMPRIC